MLEHTIEQHLEELGFLLPAKDEEKPQRGVHDALPTLTKNYFNDPRDENGEVPY